MPAQRDTAVGTLLTRDYADRPDGLRFELWIATVDGPVRVLLNRRKAYFFVPAGVGSDADAATARREYRSLDGRPVVPVTFSSMRALREERDRLERALRRPLESDIKPHDRFLMERFVTGTLEVRGQWLQRDQYREFRDPELSAARLEPGVSAGALRVLSLDIETDGLEGSLLSIAGITADHQRVFLRGQPFETSEPITFCPGEKQLLEAFLRWVRERDPDVIIGWNVIDFDLDYLVRRCRALDVPFVLGRGATPATVLAPRSRQQHSVARVAGRAVLDGIDTLRTATIQFEDYRLAAVAQQVLGRGKAIAETDDPVAEIRRMYHEAPEQLAHYNLEDCRLVLEIFHELRLLEFAVERQQLTGLALGRPGGSVAAFDHLYLPRLHRKGIVAPDVAATPIPRPSPGGYVLDSRPGIYRNVLVLDFKSLYPSIIRTFAVDPYGLAFPGDDPIEGFEGGTFAREGAILPQLIASLWQARDQAKARRDDASSRAIKILMNSFYGVLGTPFCRFFDWRLASSITRRGHEILTRSRAFFEQREIAVIYGDTDSLFLWIGDAASPDEARRRGAELAGDLNRFWTRTIRDEHRLDSQLEVEFEAHFRRFLMPTARESEQGSKKRYAGLVGDELLIKGLEAVRSDWTPVARALQRELIRRVLEGQPYREFLRQLFDAVGRGERDAELVYRKRLRRPLDEYQGAAPPHVQAARKLANAPRWVRYVITRRGPEPVVGGTIPPALDYEHYLERQLGPAADVVLTLLGERFADLAGAQLTLF